MNDCGWAEQVALASDGGDESVTPELHNHLNRCEACRELFRELRSDRLLLAIEPSLPRDAVEAVGRSVRARIRKTRVYRGLAVAASAAAVLIAVLTLEPRKSSEQPVALQRPEVVKAQQPTLQSVIKPDVRIRRTSRKRVQPPPPSLQIVATRDQIVIQKRTADPNVVIVLVGDLEGGGDE